MKQIYLFAFFITFFTYSYSQISINSEEKINEEAQIFKYKVKLLDDFMDRFNYERNFEGEKIKNDDSFKYDRAFMLKSLFEYEYYLKDSSLAQEFTQWILKNNITLDFYSNNWYSVANVTILYNKISYSADLKMQIESETSDRRAKWVIKDVAAPFLNVEKQNTNLFIHPVAHETNFISLSEAFNNSQDIFEYTDSNFVTSELNIFLFLIKTKQLTLTKINEVSYIFDLQNWSFEVRNYNRMQYNSGWLICQLKKTKNVEITTTEKKESGIGNSEKVNSENEQTEKIDNQVIDVNNGNSTKTDKKKRK